MPALSSLGMNHGRRKPTAIHAKKCFFDASGKATRFLEFSGNSRKVIEKVGGDFRKLGKSGRTTYPRDAVKSCVSRFVILSHQRIFFGPT